MYDSSEQHGDWVRVWTGIEKDRLEGSCHESFELFLVLGGDAGGADGGGTADVLQRQAPVQDRAQARLFGWETARPGTRTLRQLRDPMSRPRPRIPIAYLGERPGAHVLRLLLDPLDTLGGREACQLVVNLVRYGPAECTHTDVDAIVDVSTGTWA